ncbi:sugar kinase [Sinomonas sp. JGH33]|uniref:Sugar kinase n=1 Tax=Sinomonas terricola TaxID=3110330 RepID=A0ABU5T2P0_9MICC|nr:sugar kinase [Sinomonas sp. JGH33]MEA5453807.1 sugar kinase [Sinomonas sp. JGH33]
MIDHGARRPRVVTLGETMALARTVETGSLRHVSSLALGIGGAESNVAIALSRLGVDVSWLGRVGDDPLGERVLREIRAEGVEVLGIVDPDAPTGLMLKERATASATSVYYYRSASAGSRLSPGDLPDGWVEGAAILHICGITALVSESGHAALTAAIDRAKAAGVLVSFDVNFRSSLASAGDAAPVLRGLAEQADIVFGGPEEAALLGCGESPEDIAEQLRGSGVSELVLKQGALGATAFTGSGAEESPGFLVQAVDTVGAGDAFVAGYLSAYLEGRTVAERLVRANACGAIACTSPGDWEANPTLRDLKRFIAPAGDPVNR